MYLLWSVLLTSSLPCRWKGILRDTLVLLVTVVFGVNLAQRIRHVAHEDHRHLWLVVYERTGLLLDVGILALQAFSKLMQTLTFFTAADVPIVIMFHIAPQGL